MMAGAEATQCSVITRSINNDSDMALIESKEEEGVPTTTVNLVPTAESLSSSFSGPNSTYNSMVNCESWQKQWLDAVWRSITTVPVSEDLIDVTEEESINSALNQRGIGIAAGKDETVKEETEPKTATSSAQGSHWLHAPSFQKASSSNEEESQQQLICAVCGVAARGFHFGAFTCEGCKSFFGRICLRKKTTLLECRQGGACDVMGERRTVCKACRFNKCLHAGMSPMNSRFGRRSKYFKVSAERAAMKPHTSACAEPSTSIGTPSKMLPSTSLVNHRPALPYRGPGLSWFPGAVTGFPGTIPPFHSPLHSVPSLGPGKFLGSIFPPLEIQQLYAARYLWQRCLGAGKESK